MRFPLVLAVVFVAAGCADPTAPSESGEPGAKAAPTATTTAVAMPVRTAEPAGPARVHAAHILIAYQGALRSRATRSKEEAKKVAEQVLARAKGGADSSELAKNFSDDPSAKARGGDLGTFDRAQMTQKFSDAAFALQPGQVSDVVETEFGFHIIKRLE